jgi:DNA polymerase III delta prime subunit
MADILTGDSPVEATAKLAQFKDYAVSHPQLVQVDEVLRRAIREPAGFAHVLVYGPSGVGKTTMIRQIVRRFQEAALASQSAPPSYPNGSSAPVPLLLLETRPPDGGAFNRADYYRTALKLLGEPFYERRLLVDVDSEQAWEKKGRSRRQATQFNDSPELRQALEAAMARRGVRAVILDEAQHLLKLGSGSSGGKLLDQLDWLKSMTNVTGVLHILIGTYELVPLATDIPALMQHWFYFYERSIGCVGVLKDWLIRAVAAALHDGSETLTLARMEEHALTLAQYRKLPLMQIARSVRPPVPKIPQKKQHPPRKSLPDGSDSASLSEIRSAKIKIGG